MPIALRTVPVRTVAEFAFTTTRAYRNPFTDVVVDARFTGPAGQTFTVPAFYAGDATWKVRFNPNEAGRWTYQAVSRPENPDLIAEGSFDVTPRSTSGFLRASPGQAWGFQYESGEPAFLFGDTVYNLFGMAHCGANVDAFLERRARQGFNLLRIRLPVSPFHPPDGYNTWQTRRTWPWGGSEQSPRFDRFDLPYFETVDRVIQQAERLGIGLELIMEGWGFEFPFNSRNIFVPEWEELWLRYLIARYDAYNSTYIWTLLNEYEYYPNGDWHYKPVADRWAMRVGRWVKGVAQHGHVVAVHNGPREPAFADRFAADPEAIDAVLFQDWGTRGHDDGWLAAGIEDQISRSLAGWWGSAIFAEWGYERNPDFPLLIPGHEFCDADHTRRGAWRGAFCALGIIHGFENSWGPFLLLEEDQPGLAYLLHLRRFFTEVVPFARLKPAPHLVVPADHAPGHRPLALATPERDWLTVYLPTSGAVSLALPNASAYQAQWFDPRTGDLAPAKTDASSGETNFVAPATGSEHPDDWVLVLSRSTAS